MYLLIVVLLLVACAWGMDVHASLYARYGRRTREPRVANRLCESVFDIYRYDTGIWGFIDSFRVVLVNGMRKWYASY